LAEPAEDLAVAGVAEHEVMAAAGEDRVVAGQGPHQIVSGSGPDQVRTVRAHQPLASLRGNDDGGSGHGCHGQHHRAGEQQ